MALSASQIDYILRLNLQGQLILCSKGKEGLLHSLFPEMDQIHELLESADENEIEHYTNLYMGFAAYVGMLEAIAEIDSEKEGE